MKPGVVNERPDVKQPRERVSLDSDWKFHLGDHWRRALDLTKAGASSGPAAVEFDDSGWRTLDVPHDWAVELPFDRCAERNHGFKPVGPGFPERSVGWYRRTFELPKEDEGKRIGLTFDGIFRKATVWVNGWFISRHESGYCPLREDITDVVRFGERNVVTVRVDVTEGEGWYYEGAGIYRHVWLDKTAPVAIVPDGIFVHVCFAGNVPSDVADIHVEVEVANTLTDAVVANVQSKIIGPGGKALADFETTARIDGESQQVVRLQTTLSRPQLWSPEHPHLYRLVTGISAGGVTVDVKETEFGIRTAGFDKDQGFLLNGKRYELHGTCNHQDHAGVGVALPDALQYHRIARLKEMGCNAYRTTHHPPTPEVLDACDQLGMIVMDEHRLLGSDAATLRQLGDLIRRDRNHPSVCIWSIANEEFSAQSTVQGANVARTMQRYAKRLDPTRPVTYAAPQGDTFDGINGVIEVRGWNYNVGACMDDYHAKHPDQPNVGTEQASVVATRGIYADDPTRGYVQAYDNRGKDTAEAWWSYFAARPWLSGAFVWTGYDYRGEPTPYGWPCISSHFGILDTCGFPKDSFYYYKSWWQSEVVLHLSPHWNWPGREGQEIRVEALSNCREVELFLNGASLGRQAMKPSSKLAWNVTYAPGSLSAIGYDKEGKAIAEARVETTGQPVAVKLIRDLTGFAESLRADGTDVAVFRVSAVDAAGREVPTAQDKISFRIVGAGRIIGVGNGDPSCHEPDVFIAPSRRLRRVDGWRWRSVQVPESGTMPFERLVGGLDESGWSEVRPETHAMVGDLPLWEGRAAVYSVRIRLTEEELQSLGVRLLYSGCGGHGWYYVNGQLVGESAKWQEHPSFEVGQYLRPGDNTITVGVQHGGSWAGLNPDVYLEIIPEDTPVRWSRSLFNGLAQVIVQSGKRPGTLSLTASAEGLRPATVSLETQATDPRPVVP